MGHAQKRAIHRAAQKSSKEQPSNDGGNAPLHDTDGASTTAFLREVDDFMHYDRLEKLWRRHRFLFYGILSALLLGSIGWQFYENHAHSQAEALAETFWQAGAYYGDNTPETMAASYAKAEKMFEDLSQTPQTSQTGYGMLAAFRLAEGQQDAKALRKALQPIAQNSVLDPAYRDLARFYVAASLTETNPDAATSSLTLLVNEHSPYALSAMELLAWMAETRGDMVSALGFYERMIQTPNLPFVISHRIKERLSALSSAYAPIAPTGVSE